MRYQYTYPVIFLCLTTNIAAGFGGIDDGPNIDGNAGLPPVSPNPHYQRTLTEGSAPKQYCKESAIRYNPDQFVCIDNEIICPILTGYAAGMSADAPPRPMQRCGNQCFDPELSKCTEEKEVLRLSPAEKAAEGIIDVADGGKLFKRSDPAKENADSEGQNASGNAINNAIGDDPAAAAAAELEDEIAANNIIKRYAEAWQLVRDPIVTGDLYLSPDPMNDSTRGPKKKNAIKAKAKKPTGSESFQISRSSQYGSGISDVSSDQISRSDTAGKVANDGDYDADYENGDEEDEEDGGSDGEEEMRREEDSHLGLGKRWNINQLKGGEPVIRVKQQYDPKTNVKMRNEKLSIEEANVVSQDKKKLDQEKIKKQNDNDDDDDDDDEEEEEEEGDDLDDEAGESISAAIETDNEDDAAAEAAAIEVEEPQTTPNDEEEYPEPATVEESTENNNADYDDGRSDYPIDMHVGDLGEDFDRMFAAEGTDDAYHQAQLLEVLERMERIYARFMVFDMGGRGGDEDREL